MSAGSGGAAMLVKIETSKNFDLQNALVIEQARTAVHGLTIQFLQRQVEQQNLLIQRLQRRSPN